MADNNELPTMRLHMKDSDEVFEATPENTSLFQFAGLAASRSHVFLQTGESEADSSVTGAYIFSFNPSYKQMVQFMVAHEFPMHLNLRQVADCDEDAYQDAIAKASEGSADNIDDEFNKLLGGEE